MIRRLYIHNFRCLENFELRLDQFSSALLIGKNGAGKTSLLMALEVLQQVARGVNRVGSILKHTDLTRDKKILRLELEVDVNSKIYAYALVLELPEKFKELRVSEEKLTVDGAVVFSRKLARVRLTRQGAALEAEFGIDWHLVALPIILDDRIQPFIAWLANALILKPIPSLCQGASETTTLRPDANVKNLGEWLTGLLMSEPRAYAAIASFLKNVMPGFGSIKNPERGGIGRNVVVSFSSESEAFDLPFDSLSDGEKCFVIFSLVIAANEITGPVLCCWDEPDNFLSPSEIGATTMALRKAFKGQGQLLITSHSPEVIRQFSDENTFVLSRNSHAEPTIVRTVEDYRNKKDLEGGLVDAILRGDLL